MKKGEEMKKGHLDAIGELIVINPQIIILISDNAESTHEVIRKKYPKYCINYGISECNMLASAAGLAKEGRIPIVYSVSNFLSMRGYEFIRNLICLSKCNVKIVGINSGFSGSHMGPTHQATEDIAIMRALPNLMLISPSSSRETYIATKHMIQYQGPVYLRLEREMESQEIIDQCEVDLNKWLRVRTIFEGNDISIISTGAVLEEVVVAAQELELYGIMAEIIDVAQIKPINSEIILNSARKTKHVITVEEHNVVGGLGSAIAELLMDSNLGEQIVFKRLGLPDTFNYQYASRKELRGIYGIDAKNIVYYAKKMSRLNYDKKGLIKK